MTPLTPRGSLFVMVLVNLVLLAALVAGDHAMRARDVSQGARRAIELAFIGPPAVWVLVADYRRRRRPSAR